MQIADIGWAVTQLKAGYRVRRRGWNGKGMFLFLLPAGTVPKTVVHDPALKAVLDREIPGPTFDALASIRMFTADKKILTGWLASQTDLLADDWELATDDPAPPAAESAPAPASKPQDMGNVSDGYHTFNELYEHRHALFIALGSAIQHSQPAKSDAVWFSAEHNDGSAMEGWLIAGIDLPQVGAITYHLPTGYTDVLERAGFMRLPLGKAWDGHTATGVITRLLSFAVIVGNGRRIPPT